MNNFFRFAKISLAAISIFALAMLSGCGGGGGGGITPSAGTLNSIAITPPSLTVTNGKTEILSAIGTYSDGSTADITSQVTWIVDAPEIATVSGDGVITGIAVGNATITASFKAITSQSAIISVTDATLSGIAITPADVSLAIGPNTYLSAIGTYSDGSSFDISSQVTWTSASPTTATVGLHTGTVTGVTVGSTSVYASMGGITSSVTKITITDATLSSITITADATLAKGTNTLLSATGIYSDGTTADLTTMVTWTSADPSIATVESHTGSVVGTAIGTTTVSAALGGISSLNSTDINVVAATLSSIAVTPLSVSIAKGKNTNLSATGTYSDGSTADLSLQVTWTSDSPATASVGLHTGVVSGADVGSTVVHAMLDGITSPDANITVTAAILSSISITAGATLTINTSTNLFATGIYSDGSTNDLTTQVAWTSTAPSTATIGSNTGTIIGTAIGTTTVTATLNDMTSNSANVNVIDATLSSLSITPASISLAKGMKTSLSATGTYSDGSSYDISTQVNWTSVAPATASVGTNTGVVQGSNIGTTSIFASMNGVDAPSIDVTVTPAVLTNISITPSSVSFVQGTTTDLTATGTYSDSTKVNITTLATWTSDAPTIATVGSNTGNLTGVAAGNASVSASLDGVSSLTVSITVKPYATWNPADKGPDVTLDSLYLTATASKMYESVRATYGINSGTAYWEVTPISGSGVIGVMTTSAKISSWVGSDKYGWGLYSSSGNLYGKNKNPSWATTIVAKSSVVGFGLDMNAGNLRIWVNGVDKGIAFTGLTGTIYPATTVFRNGINANFGATPFKYPQAGYTAGVFQH